MALSFAEQTSREIATLLCGRFGFTKKDGVLWLTVSPSCQGSLGLGRATYGSSYMVDIGPTVGLKFPDLYRLEVELGASPDTKMGCNLSTGLRYLVPELNEYSFRKEEDSEPVIQRLMGDVERYALPFYEAHSSIDSAMAHVKHKPSHIFGIHTFLPVALFHKGQHREAIDHAKAFGANFDPRRAPGKRYHQFIANLEEAVNRAERA